MIVIFYHGLSIMIELRWLRSFLAVADEMHLSRAARKLHLAQPALTTQIQQLERFLGSSLFQRSNRIRDLTAAGLVLLPEARAIVARAEALPGIVERAARGETGRLRLGIIPPAATNRLAECLRTISLELPDMDLTVRQGSQDDLTSDLIQHALDLVIGRPLAEKKSGLSELHLFSEQHGIIIRQTDPLAKLRAPRLGASGRRPVNRSHLRLSAKLTFAASRAGTFAGFRRFSIRIMERLHLAALGTGRRRICKDVVSKIIKDAGFRFRKAKKVLTSGNPAGRILQ